MLEVQAANHSKRAATPHDGARLPTRA